MTNDVPDITLTGVWQSVYALSSITVGAAITVQNKTAQIIHVWIGASAPASGFVGGLALAPLATASLAIGASGYWALGNGPMYVQAL